MADKLYEPINHDASSRMGHAVGSGASRGFWWGLAGAAVGLMALPAIAVGVAAYAGVAGAWALGAIGVGTALASSIIGVPAMLAGTAIGAGLGALTGGNKSLKQTAQERSAYRYQAAYQGQMQALQGQLASAVQAAQEREYEMAYGQPAIEEKPAVMEQAGDVPTTKVSAEAARYDQRVADAGLEAARG